MNNCVVSFCVQSTIHYGQRTGRKSNTRACPHSNTYIKYRPSCNRLLHVVMTFIVLHTICNSESNQLTNAIASHCGASLRYIAQVHMRKWYTVANSVMKSHYETSNILSERSVHSLLFYSLKVYSKLIYVGFTQTRRNEICSQLQGICSLCVLHKSFPVKEEFCLYIRVEFISQIIRGLPAAVNEK